MAVAEDKPVRILHISDVHLEDGFSQVPLRELASKRLVGLANLMLRRGPHFIDAANKVATLPEFIKEHDVDVVMCTGDYTALGTHPELEFARAAMTPLVAAAPLGFVTVPGNHDLYLPDTVADGRFDQYFGDLLKTDLPELSCDGLWPQVRLFGSHLAVIAVNSARPNPEIARSSGRITDEQLDRLDAIVNDERVRDRFVIIATHYAPRLANGWPDRPLHGLENADAFLDVCGQVDRGAICFGHIHWRYHVRIEGIRMDLCCSGSTTHGGREGLWLYEVGSDTATATPGQWSQTRYVLSEEERFRLNA